MCIKACSVVVTARITNTDFIIQHPPDRYVCVCMPSGLPTHRVRRVAHTKLIPRFMLNTSVRARAHISGEHNDGFCRSPAHAGTSPVTL